MKVGKIAFLVSITNDFTTEQEYLSLTVTSYVLFIFSSEFIIYDKTLLSGNVTPLIARVVSSPVISILTSSFVLFPVAKLPPFCAVNVISGLL